MWRERKIAAVSPFPISAMRSHTGSSNFRSRMSSILKASNQQDLSTITKTPEASNWPILPPLAKAKHISFLSKIQHSLSPIFQKSTSKHTPSSHLSTVSSPCYRQTKTSVRNATITSTWQQIVNLWVRWLFYGCTILSLYRPTTCSRSIWSLWPLSVSRTTFTMLWRRSIWPSTCLLERSRSLLSTQREAQ